MKVVLQRVSEGGVFIQANGYSAEIKKGLVLLVAVKDDDTESDINFTADKCCNLRVFEDENEKMNLSVKDVNGEVLIISQFTLYGDTRKGNRPGFTSSAKPETAIPLYEKFIKRVISNLGEEKVKTGLFGAMMKVKIINDGPVTLIVESKNDGAN
ncbi:MAG: D-tyrosyl-tRNA(Tyr) deacylase [Ignavibacteriales bacterium]|nr:MAG: D-tyrosyl-tRNA(Tyr) deacylase [Ignavibacteriales bacterium]